jgi:hypothetical protein
MLLGGCRSFRFEDIRTYSHDENPAKCYWLNSETGEQIPCIDKNLINYMCIPISEYIAFTKDYVCSLKEEVEKEIGR